MTKAAFLYFYALAALVVPNVVMCFTERMTWLQNLSSCLAAISVYGLCLALPKRLGKAVWWMFPFIFFGAFNIVLLYLFGRGVIAVDMFLNLVTTNAGEAGELLGNIAPSLLYVIVLYIPLLVFASIAMKKGYALSQVSRKTLRKRALGGVCVSALLLGLCHISYPHYRESEKVFPVNAMHNLCMAFQRTYQSKHYHQTSKDFSFQAISLRPETEREIYVVIIGETARAMNFGINGYGRNTTPDLAKADGLVSFTKAYTQSNTTHKSVPMLLSAVSAKDFNEIVRQKGINEAFREAGYKTFFISAQKPNHSYIDFFAQEADETEYFDQLQSSGERQAVDFECLPALDRAIADSSKKKSFVVIHTYGSHFNYRDRYTESQARFLPDQPSDAKVENAEFLRNAYDNSIAMTDSLLYSVISRLQIAGTVSAMFYVSDHGENIYDDYRHKFLHASPIPSWYELRVPMIVWMSEKYREKYSGIWETVNSHRDSVVQTSESLFHTVMEIAGLDSPVCDKSLSVADSSYKAGERLYLTDRNSAQTYEALSLDAVDLENLDL